jgi:hypothetical protein
MGLKLVSRHQRRAPSAAMQALRRREEWQRRYVELVTKLMILPGT